MLNTVCLIPWLALLLSLLPCMLAADESPFSTERAAELVRNGNLKPLVENALTFVQVTDTHTQGTDPRDFRHSSQLLTSVMEEIETLYPAASFTVFTGDNCDTGGSYNETRQADFRALVNRAISGFPNV